MDWRDLARAEYARLGKQVDDEIVEELAQHASAAFEALSSTAAWRRCSSRQVYLPRWVPPGAARVDPVVALRAECCLPSHVGLRKSSRPRVENHARERVTSLLLLIRCSVGLAR
ncbi:MAG TPA: hypothetical protein VH679_07135 [Vicinamibacterales bacterium]|jgi:hypothetical protein